MTAPTAVGKGLALVEEDEVMDANKMTGRRSEMAYTRGPLTIKGPSSGLNKAIDDGGDYAILKDGFIIGEAICLVGELPSRVSITADAEANARLWASAPDLLAENAKLRAAVEKLRHELAEVLVQLDFRSESLRIAEEAILSLMRSNEPEQDEDARIATAVAEHEAEEAQRIADTLAFEAWMGEE